MITFVIVASVLTLIALSFVLPGLLRKKQDTNVVVRNELNLTVMRDQLHELDRDLAIGTLSETTFSSAKSDLEQRLIEEMQPLTETIASTGYRWVPVAVGLFIPVLVVGLYLLLGNSDALNPARVAAQDPSHEITEQQVVQMVSNLAEKLKAQPNNVEGWNMLARSYNALGRYDDAVKAYAHLIQIEPKNADYLVSYADTLAVTLNRNLQGEPEKIIKRALELDPQNIRGLILAGSAAFDRRDYADAIAYWKVVLTVAPPDSEMAKSTLSSIGEAQSLLDGNTQPAAVSAQEPTVVPATTTAATTAEVTKAVKISGSVDLAPELKAKVSATDTVYIYARANQGPPFPLAVLRRQVKDLPLHFVLDESMGVVPNANLSGHTTVVVGARISKSGNATPASGDLESAVKTVSVGVDNVVISINAQHP